MMPYQRRQLALMSSRDHLTSVELIVRRAAQTSLAVGMASVQLDNERKDMPVIQMAKGSSCLLSDTASKKK